MGVPIVESRGRVLVNSSGAEVTGFTVAGGIAADAPYTANPVPTGSLGTAAPTTLTAVTANDVVRNAANLFGEQYFAVSGYDGGAGSDGRNRIYWVSGQTSPASTTVVPLASGPFNFNDTTWDRQRGNLNTAALITAAGATTTQTGADQTNYNGRGVQVVLNMTVVGTGSVTITIQGKDNASSAYYTLLAGAAVVTNSTNLYTVYPGAPTTANVSASLPLPRTWRVLVTANNANATTYTVGASVIL